MSDYEITDFFTVSENNPEYCRCDICDNALPSGDNEGLVSHLLNNHLSPIVHVYEVSNKERKNMTVQEFVKYANESYDDDIVCSLDENEIDNVQVTEDDDLTEYDVEKQVTTKTRAYVMAKDHEEACKIFDRLKESEVETMDFDDEYKVDGEEQD